jgi:hypothetical protein
VYLEGWGFNVFCYYIPAFDTRSGGTLTNHDGIATPAVVVSSWEDVSNEIIGRGEERKAYDGVSRGGPSEII